MSWNKYVTSENDPETEATPLTTTLNPEEKQSESDSHRYEAVTVCVPAEMPPVVPVTGESFCQCPAQTELSSDAQINPNTLTCTCGEEEQGYDWVWDEDSKSSAVTLSCSNRKVGFHSEYSCGTAAIRGTKALSDGQHFWEIKMTSPVYGTDMMVGVGTAEVNLDQYRHSFCSLLGTDGDSWGLSYTGFLHHKGSKVTFSSRFGQGSIIGLHLDTWHGTLSFYKNRRCIGVAATHLQNKRLYPIVCSTAAKSSMKLIRSHSVPTTLQYLCCAQLRTMLPDSADALRVLPLPPGLRLLLSNQLGWVLNLGCADSCKETAMQTEDEDCADDCTNPISSSRLSEYTPSICDPVFISSSVSDSYLNPDYDSQLDSPPFLEPTECPDPNSCADQVSYQAAASIMDVACYLDPLSHSDHALYLGSTPGPEHTSPSIPHFHHVSTSCPCFVTPVSPASDGHMINVRSSLYKPDANASAETCMFCPSSTVSGPTLFWSDSASDSDSDDCCSDPEIYQRKRCRWT